MSAKTGYQRFLQNALKYGFSLFGLPKTGITNVVTPGDDGSYQKGYPKTGPRYTDNSDGTITDNATGLMWTKNVVWFWKTLADAIAYCEAQTWLGHDDWRLPNIREMMSIADYGRYNPAMDPIFTIDGLDYVWTSSYLKDDPTRGWYLYITDGTIGYTVVSNTCRFFAVRGGA